MDSSHPAMTTGRKKEGGGALRAEGQDLECFPRTPDWWQGSGGRSEAGGLSVPVYTSAQSKCRHQMCPGEEVTGRAGP